MDMRIDVHGYIAMSVRVDIARISYGYADIARTSHGYSTTRRHAAGEITRRTPSCYSYVCHCPVSELQRPKPVPSFAGLCPALGDALCKHARNTTTTTCRRTHAPCTDVFSLRTTSLDGLGLRKLRPPFEHQSSGSSLALLAMREVGVLRGDGLRERCQARLVDRVQVGTPLAAVGSMRT